MKQTLLSVNLRGLRGVHAVMLLTFLSLFMSFGASAQATLPTKHNGRWQLAGSLPTGWTQSNLDSDPSFTNLTSTGYSDASNTTDTRVASFSATNAMLRIDFSTAPQKLNFLYNAKGAGFNGVLVVEAASTAGGTYTEIDRITSESGKSLSNSSDKSLNLTTDIRSVRFRLLSFGSNSTAFLLDQVAVTRLPSPSIVSFTPGSGPVQTVVSVTGANLPAEYGIGFFNANGDIVFADDMDYPSANVITGKVPFGAVSGKIALVDGDGAVLALSDTDFYVTPEIASLSPDKGEAGTKVAIAGTNLTNIQSITINGATASYEEVNGVLTATVPADASTGTGSLIISTLGGLDSAPFTVEASPLPVELVNFNATPTSSGAKLTWQTASEQDNAYFEVQSTNNLKSGEFKTLGRVETKGSNSSTLLSYSYLDGTAARGTTVYYRLKQVDTDGDFEYSKVVTVNLKQGATAKGLVNVYPNPFKEQINLEVEAEKAGTLVATLYDARGYKVFARSITVELGASNIIVELPANLKTGLYFLTTQVDGNTKTTRLIKE